MINMKSLVEFIAESANDDKIYNAVENVFNNCYAGSFGNGLEIDAQDLLDLYDVCLKLPKITSIDSPSSTKQKDLPKLPKCYVALVETKRGTSEVYFVNQDSKYATPRRGLALPNDALPFSSKFVVSPTTNIYDNWQHFERAAEKVDIYKIDAELVDKIWTLYNKVQKEKTEEYKNKYK